MTLPLILEPEVLEAHLGEEDLRIVDLSKPEVHARFHVPGAVHLDYRRLVAKRGMAGGLLPDDDTLEEVLSALGIGPQTHVVAYDDEGGGKAARLLWTLDALGHGRFSLLNGGLHAWANEGHPLEAAPGQVEPTPFEVPGEKRALVGAEDILERLGDPRRVILDARSPREYLGLVRTARKSGHIPGAVNFEWTEAMDPSRNLRLKDQDALQKALEGRGVTPDKEVIVHCQTHHRSAHTYIVLKALGYPDVKAYPGSWSEWGNRTDTPVETQAA